MQIIQQSDRSRREARKRVWSTGCTIAKRRRWERVGRSRANVGRAYVDVAFVAWDRLRVCAWIGSLPRHGGFACVLLPPATTPVIVTRLIAARGVGVSPSLSRCPLFLSLFLSSATRDTNVHHLHSLFPFAFSHLPFAYFFLSSSWRVSYFARAASFFSSFGITRMWWRLLPSMSTYHRSCLSINLVHG